MTKNEELAFAIQQKEIIELKSIVLNYQLNEVNNHIDILKNDLLKEDNKCDTK